MVEINPPSWFQDREDHTAAVARGVLTSIIRYGGVVNTNHLRTEQTATASMSVRVTPGRVIVHGEHGSLQGMYACINEGDTTVQLDASGSQPRIDLIVARIYDKEYQAADTSVWVVEAIKGTPATNPTPPSVPLSAVPLSHVRVNASASSVTNANITDVREFCELQPRITPPQAEHRWLHQADNQVSATGNLVIPSQTINLPFGWTMMDLNITYDISASIAGTGDDAPRLRIELESPNGSVLQARMVSFPPGPNGVHKYGNISVTLERTGITASTTTRARFFTDRSDGGNSISVRHRLVSVTKYRVQ